MPLSKRESGLILAVILILLAGSIGVGWNLWNGAVVEESLIYNPGPSRLAGITIAQTPQGVRCHIVGSSLEEVGAVMNRPPQRHHNLDCFGGALPGRDQIGGSTFTHDTTVGWKAEDAGKSPGWNIERLAGGHGKPIHWRYTNRALDVADPCTLREVGLIYQGWPHRPDSAFRVNADNSRLTLGQFKSIKARFKARIVEDRGPSRCQNFASSYITLDFRVVYYNNPVEAKSVRLDLVGVILYRGQGSAAYLNDGKDKTIYWRGASPERSISLVVGTELGQKIAPLDDKLRSFEIELTDLAQFMPPPPPGHSRNDAVLAGLDIYTSVRGADLSFELTDINLIGIR